jgi:hypothetical protein
MPFLYTKKLVAEINSLYTASIQRKTDNKLFVNLVSADDPNLKVFGINSEYIHSIDENGIRHALKHKNISISDILLIPVIITSYDKLRAGNKPNTIVYEKNFADTIVYIVEIRKGRKKLTMKTMYKKKLKPRITPKL